jgi:starch phosphorylase
MMKKSMRQLGQVYNTSRMVRQYSEKFYLNAHKNRKTLMAKDWTEAKKFTSWKENLLNNWNKIHFVNVHKTLKNGDISVGSKYKVKAEVDLGALNWDDVEVQIYYGKVDEINLPYSHSHITMNCKNKKSENSKYIFEGEIECSTTGQFGYTVRILPNHPMLINKFELGLIIWA